MREGSSPRLRTEQGVPHEYRLYGTGGQKYMAHVFHLNIRLPEAEVCNTEECNFFLSV